MKLKPDTRLRKAWFTDEAMSHPAKGHLGLWWEILERYTQPGQTVLDPMSGIGSSLIAAMMGRNVICNEMETHFLEPMVASWAKMQTVGPMLGHQMGKAVIVRGDARMLPLQSADAIITSPPYEGSIQGEPGIDWSKMDGGKRDMTKEAAQQTRIRSLSGYTRPVSAVVTSPPYEHEVNSPKSPAGKGLSSEPIHHSEWHRTKGYTRPVDAVVTSPPYEHSISRNTDDTTNRYEYNPEWAEREGRSQSQLSDSFLAGTYSTNGSTNIGNLRGDRYWEAMGAVYRECHRVLIPGGVMVLVVKGYTRAKVYVNLPQQTADLIETLGFQVFDRWEREVPLSFWRTLQKANGNWDEALRYEHIIAARKL